MSSENIIGINIPNGISILIMCVVGGLLLTAARKFAGGRGGFGGNVTTGPAFTG